MNFRLTTLLLFLSLLSNAQYRIEGKVIDSVTQKPLTNINIFLSHTSNGTYSNDKGEFQLGNLKQGKYELVISSLNYEETIIPISVIQNVNPFLIKLKPSTNILKEVVVEPFDKNGRDEWGEKFKSYFVGSNQLAKYCKLLNPEVVKFRFNAKTNKLKAFANEMLVFENRSLGYKIKYLLSKFEIDFTYKTFSFKGYPLFEELKPGNTKEANQWNQLRNETYKGSIRHFMRSLYFNQLQNEGFEIREVKMISDEEKNRVRELAKAIQKKVDAEGGDKVQLEKDSLEYYNKVNSLPLEVNSFLLNNIIPCEQVVINSNSTIDSTFKTLYFEGYLQVMYKNKKIPYEYAKSLPLYRSNENIKTDISLKNNKPISIYPNGNYYNGLDLLIDGYWSWSEKVSTLMPSDYVIIK
jgi:hypothetical protein